MKKNFPAVAAAAVVLMSLTGCLMSPSTVTTTPAPQTSTEAPAPTQTQEETTPTPTEEPAASEGTRENPFAPNERLTGGDWEGIIGVTNLNANQAVADGNMFNEPAPEGFVYISIPVAVTYTGTQEANTMEVSVEYVTAAGEVVDTSTYGSFVAADDTNPMQDLFSGGSAAFTEYLLVPAENVDQGVLRVNFGWINGATGFVSLS